MTRLYLKEKHRSLIIEIKQTLDAGKDWSIKRVSDSTDPDYEKFETFSYLFSNDFLFNSFDSINDKIVYRASKGFHNAAKAKGFALANREPLGSIENYTYLVGAGASIHSIPVVNIIKQRMKSIIQLLKTNFSLRDELFDSKWNISVTKKEAQEDFFESIEWLVAESDDNSIDNYAKKLSYKEDFESLNRLKATLSCYLIFEHSIHEPYVINGKEYFLKRIDPRYENFFARIIDSPSSPIRPDIKILNWNYDLQFEKSFKQFRDIYVIELLKELKSYPIPEGHKLVDVDLDSFCIIKLNGTAGFHYNDNVLYSGNFESAFNDISLSIVEECIKNYYLNVHQSYRLRSFINFAWENNPINDHYLNQAIRIAETTKELIIIGYSFPDFNMEIDKKILSAMKNLKKIVIQNIPDEAKRIKNLLEEQFNKIKIDLYTNLNQFYLPRN